MTSQQPSTQFTWAQETSVQNRIIRIPIQDEAGEPAGDLVMDQAAARDLIHALWVMMGYGPEHDAVALDDNGSLVYLKILPDATEVHGNSHYGGSLMRVDH